MGRQRTIVGIGEALLVEHPDRIEPAGLAVETALEAVRLGHRGVAISRLGQDETARELLDRLRERDVITTHMQADPDLPTGRVIVRSIGAPIVRHLESRVAFDNLQSDFDLEDVAQVADAVVFGMLTRRGGQSRSEENRFVSACGSALKLFDLTNCAQMDASMRVHAVSGLELAECALLNQAALELVRPGAADESPADAAQHVRHAHRLDLILTALTTDQDRVRLAAHSEEAPHEIELPAGRPAQMAAQVALLHSLLGGNRITDALDFAARAGAFRAEKGDEDYPDDWLN